MSSEQYITLIEGPYKIWTKKYMLNKNMESNINILVVNGNPGSSHDYMKPFKCLTEHNFTVYFYDQLGTGKSHPELTDTSLWTLDRYVDEIEQVRIGLGLDKFVLCGHSYGGMLTIEYALKYPEHLSSIIISNVSASMSSCMDGYRRFRHYLTYEEKQDLEYCERNKCFDCPQYQEILFNLNSKYICQKPLPRCAIKSLCTINKNIYETMYGKNEFFPEGNLSTWERWYSLCQIKVPTLLIVGQYDMISVESVTKMQRIISGSVPCTMVICENSAHLSMIDNPDTYFGAIITFCNKHD